MCGLIWRRNNPKSSRALTMMLSFHSASVSRTSFTNGSACSACISHPFPMVSSVDDPECNVKRDEAPCASNDYPDQPQKLIPESNQPRIAMHIPGKQRHPDRDGR